MKNTIEYYCLPLLGQNCQQFVFLFSEMSAGRTPKKFYHVNYICFEVCFTEKCFFSYLGYRMAWVTFFKTKQQN